jgi:hypothetical protein
MFPAVLIQMLVVLLVVGVILWALSQFPIDPTISKVIRVVVIVVVCIWVIYLLLGMAGGAGASIPVYRR